MVADHDHSFPDLSGKGPHHQRQTGVTVADCTVRPKQESESIFDGLHCALQVEEGDLRLRHRVSTPAARVNPWGLSGRQRHCNTDGLHRLTGEPGIVRPAACASSPGLVYTATEIAPAASREEAVDNPANQVNKPHGVAAQMPVSRVGDTEREIAYLEAGPRRQP